MLYFPLSKHNHAGAPATARQHVHVFGAPAPMGSLDTGVSRVVQTIITVGHARRFAQQLGFNQEAINRWIFLSRTFDTDRPDFFATWPWIPSAFESTAEEVAHRLAVSRAVRRLLRLLESSYTLQDVAALFWRAAAPRRRQVTRPPKQAIKLTTALRFVFMVLSGFFGANKVCARNNP